ncbi:MAG: tetratricopeptide repeat protein, partial [Bacteroidales bacterium]|nr:tetratricopeptide repeat protein [Bacteroidales bacterium]
MKQVHIKNKIFAFSLIIFVLFNLSCRQNNASHYFKNGSAKYQLKNYKSALTDLDQAIELENDYIDAYYVRALCYGNLKKYDRAENDFNKVIELNPDYKDAYINRGFYVLEKKGDFQAAINDYNKYLDLNKNGDNAFAFNNRGYAKYKLNDFAGAMNDIQESIHSNPDNSFVYKNRALIYISLDSINLACQDLEQANKLGFSEEY